MGTRFCPVKLTVEEHSVARSKVSDLVSEFAAAVDQSEAEKKDEAAAKKAREAALEELRLRMIQANRIASTGVEMRMVEVEERPNIATWRIETVRLDTEEIVDSRPMTEAERAKYAQKDLFPSATESAEPTTPKALSAEELPNQAGSADSQPDVLEIAEQWAAGWLHDPAARTSETELERDWIACATEAGINPSLVSWKRALKDGTGAVRVRGTDCYNVRRPTADELAAVGADEAKNITPILDV